MHKYFLLLILLPLITSGGYFQDELDLNCEVYSISPMDSPNPKAKDWWTTQHLIEKISLHINSKVSMKGMLFEENWEYTGKLNNWSINIFFNNTSKIYINTLTGEGFFYKKYDFELENNNPSYKIKCEKNNGPH